jgi:NADH-quinone oxidoreductase subunit I
MAIVVKRARLNLLERLYLWEIGRGMAITLRHFFKNLINMNRLPTLNYPEQKRILAPNYRGLHHLLKRENGELKCTACKLCMQACPSNCIIVESAKQPDGKIMRTPARYEIDISRCAFCGYCVEACPFDAIGMDTGIYELADSKPANFTYTKEKLSSF